jgi:hypothetical protein
MFTGSASNRWARNDTLHPPDDFELFDWQTAHDNAKAAVVAYAKQYARWGQVIRISKALQSPLLKCDHCKRPRAQALFVTWNTILLCEKHKVAFNRKRAQEFGWRGKIHRLERQYQERVREAQAKGWQ